MSRRKIGWLDGYIGQAAEIAAKGAQTKREKGIKPKRKPKKAKPKEEATPQSQLVATIDLSSCCPVCRSQEPCECDEEDRSFVRRTRFEKGVTKVARCPRCEAPLSILYVARECSKSPPPRSLAQFDAIYACACCSGNALATVAASQEERVKD